MKKVERWVKSWARVRCVKGDRRLIDVARAFGHKDIIRLLEDYEQINEFVCATFACDLSRTVEALALGAGFVISSSLSLLHDTIERNLPIANRLRVCCTHNTSMASIVIPLP